MLTFNTLLRSENIDPADVRLARHQDSRFPDRPTPYELWRLDDGRFDAYQQIQGRKVFKVGGWLASFVVTPANDTLFVGLYSVDGIGIVPPGIKCPIALDARDVTGCTMYDIKPSSRLGRYSGLLVIDWGMGYRSWVQLAKNQDKPVLEIRKAIIEPNFPGFRDFQWDVSKIETIPFSWREALRAVNGIYVLVCQETGKQYVGSAYGYDGLWGRFVDYAKNGHGGNVELKRRGAACYQVSVLEVIPPTASFEDIMKAENAWKEKLGSRKHGLNEN